MSQSFSGKESSHVADQDKPGIGLYMKLKEMFPQLVYHQLPEGCKDLSDYYQSFYVQKM